MSLHPMSLHPDYPRCGDLSEVDKPSTWELGPRILQVSPLRFQIHLLYETRHVWDCIKTHLTFPQKSSGDQGHQLRRVDWADLFWRAGQETQLHHGRLGDDCEHLCHQVFACLFVNLHLVIVITDDATGWKRPGACGQVDWSHWAPDERSPCTQVSTEVVVVYQTRVSAVGSQTLL